MIPLANCEWCSHFNDTPRCDMKYVPQLWQGVGIGFDWRWSRRCADYEASERGPYISITTEGEVLGDE